MCVVPDERPATKTNKHSVTTREVREKCVSSPEKSGLIDVSVLQKEQKHEEGTTRAPSWQGISLILSMMMFVIECLSNKIWFVE